MTTALVCLSVAAASTQAPSGPILLAIPEPSSNEIHLQAIVRLPALQRQELGAANVFAKVLFDGTAKYSRYQLLQYGSQTGDPPSVSLMPSHLRITMSFPKDQLDVGASMLASVLKEPTLDEERIADAIAALRAVRRGFWRTALWPSQPDYARLRREGVEDFYFRYVRPENLAVVVSGAIAPEQVQSQWEARLRDWSPPLPRRMPLQTGPPLDVSQHDHGPATYELMLPPFSGTDPSLATRLLCVAALGMGKGSSLFRVLREAMTWSYRQEAFLWPVPEGFRGRILWASTSPEVSWQKAQEALLADVSAWTEDDRLRAVGTLEGALVYGIGANPIYVAPDGPMSARPKDLAFLRAFWYFKTGRPWDAEALLAQARLVRLEELKETASKMLSAAMPRRIAGRMRAEP